jgi:hypothetical protein
MEGIMILALLESIPLIKLTLIIIEVREVMTRARKTSHKCFAEVTSLGGGPGHILPLLGLLLMMWVHPEIRQ